MMADGVMDGGIETNCAAACASGVIVDTRAPISYAAGHLTSSCSLPLAELAARSGELPPATADGVWVVAEPDEMEPTLAFLRNRHDAAAEAAAAAPAHKAAGWRVLGTLSASASLWATAQQLGLFEEGVASRRLWSPSPHLPRVAPLLEATHGIEAVRDEARPDALPLHAIDLGCGKGRDAVYLARRGWHVVGVDNQPSFLRHLEAFAARQGLGARVGAELLDLRVHRPGCVARLRELLAPPLQLVCVARFMSRALLDEVVDAMPAGCCLAVHHFGLGAASLKSGKPIKGGNPDACGLAPGELAARYRRTLRVLLDEESESVEGRPLLSFVGQKTAAAEESERGAADDAAESRAESWAMAAG